MLLSPKQQSFLSGDAGPVAQKAMQILETLGRIYDAKHMIPVTSVQVSGVSYANLGEAGLEWLSVLAEGGGKAQVFTTLNPAGMDVENYAALGISETFAENQRKVLAVFEELGIITTCTCTPYLIGNLPQFGEHIAWAESSAVCYANSILGARTNREGGPSALAASLTGCTPAYGFHLDEYRKPTIHVDVSAEVKTNPDFGALGKVIGDCIQSEPTPRVPFITGIQSASLENLKSLCASIATYGGVALFHIPGITPEAYAYHPPENTLRVTPCHLHLAMDNLNDANAEEIDFVSLGCPHLSLREVQRIAQRLQGKQVNKEFWITTSRPVKGMADRMGYTEIIEAAGAKFATDTCCVVAPIKGRFNAMLTDSAKACYYARAKNQFKTRIRTFDEVITEALE